MKYTTLIFLFGLAILFQSCQKDILGEENVEEVIKTEPTVTETLWTGVSGIVTNESGDPLPNVTISYSRQEYTTDVNGYFLIKDVQADKEGGILYMSEEGHFNNYKFFLPELNTTSFMRVIMVERSNALSFNAEIGGPIEISGGGLVTFPANAIKVESSGANYDGQVTVYTHWYNPEDPNISKSMPGDLRALSTEGKIVQLSTYGMMAVELVSENGEALNLRDNTFAEIRFPLPQDTRSHAPETIETWSLDEETVYWEEEDIAELDGEFYVAQVSHFSFWNCDVPFPLVNISGKLVNQDGVALPYYSICITVQDGGQTGYGWTDSQGGFRGKVPKGERLELVIKDECGNVILTHNIEPLSNDVSLGEIELEVGGNIIINGQLMCSGIPITQGYAHICLENGLCFVALVDDQGFFEQVIDNCGAISGISVQGFDTRDYKSSDIINVTPDNEPLELGIIEVCDELDEFIRFKIDGSNEVLILDPSASIVNSTLSMEGSIDSMETLMQANITDAVFGAGNIPNTFVNYFFDFNTSESYEAVCDDCSDIEFTFTSLGENIGELIEGSYMGEVEGQTVMGSFKIIIDNISEELECTAIITPSENCGDISSVEIQISGGTSPYDIIIDGVSVGNINDDSYIISGLTLGDNGEYYIIDANGSECEGGYEIISGGLICSISSNQPTCGDNNGSATATVIGGSGGYTYEWNNGATTSQVTGLSPGIYSVTITDSNGCETICNVELEDVGQLEVFIIQDLSCDPSSSVAYIEVIGGIQPYAYLWENGSTDQEVFGLPEGPISVTVTDANGCTGEVIESIEYGQINIEIEALVASSIIECDQDGNPAGTLTIENVSGGTGPYTYLWSNANTTVMSESISLIFQENINLTITDINGCSGNQEFVFNPENPRSISGTVWNDSEGILDFLLDTLDAPIVNAEVSLYESSNFQDPIQTTTTDEDGFYIFLDVPEGSYVVRIPLATPGANFVEPNIGNDDSIDSEIIDSLSGTTEVIEHDGCKRITNIHAGMRL